MVHPVDVFLIRSTFIEGTQHFKNPPNIKTE